MIPAKAWNEAAAKIRGAQLPVGPEQSVGGGGDLPQGRIPDRARQTVWRHPFSILPVWNSDIALHGSERDETGRTHGCWCLNVTPGFLNGHPPAIRMWNEDIPGGARIWANNYGKSDPATIEGTVNQATNLFVPPVASGTHQSVLLTDPYTPFIKCTNMFDTRSKVYGADGRVSGGEVPLFMRVRGAYRPLPLDFGDFLNNLLLNADSEAVSRYLIRLINAEAPAFVDREGPNDGLPEGNRLCYQADIVLQVDRPTVTQRFEPDDIGLLRYAGFDIKLPLRNDYSARIFETPIYLPPKPPTYWDIIYGTYKEYEYDEIVLARFYLLSPTEEFRDEGPPDGTWVPFVRHNVFWNLNYSSIEQIDVFTHDTSLEYFKQILGVLAGGVAYLFAVSVVNPIEASYDLVNTAMNQTAVKGEFWTG